MTNGEIQEHCDDYDYCFRGDDVHSRSRDCGEKGVLESEYRSWCDIRSIQSVAQCVLPCLWWKDECDLGVEVFYLREVEVEGEAQVLVVVRGWARDEVACE